MRSAEKARRRPPIRAGNLTFYKIVLENSPLSWAFGSRREFGIERDPRPGGWGGPAAVMEPAAPLRRCRPTPAAGGRTVPQKSQLGLPASYRRRAPARVDDLIAKAEQDRADRLRAVERLAAAKKGTGLAKAGLRQAEYRLTLLRRSRRWMTAGHQPPG